jgi:hypothetical protein
VRLPIVAMLTSALSGSLRRSSHPQFQSKKKIQTPMSLSSRAGFT